MKKILFRYVVGCVVCLVFVMCAFADSGQNAPAVASIIGWLKANWDSVLAIIGGIVSVATIIVKLTPTQKDDNALATIIKILSIFSLVNPDGSFIGKKND